MVSGRRHSAVQSFEVLYRVGGDFLPLSAPQTPLKLETREVYEDKYTPCENKDGESADEEKTVVDTEEKDGVFTAVNTENADEISQNDDNGALNDDKDLANDDKK